MEHMKLNLVPSDLTKPVCHASQYDDGRKIMLELYDGQDPYILSDETIELDVKKLDGNVVTTELDVVEGNRHVIMETTEQMCAIAGRNICTLKVQKDGATIYTKNFYLAVQENATEGGIESDSDLHDLETQISGLVQNAVENQYDSENVIFDSEPTEGHGTGYTVTSAGIKAAIDAAGGGGASIDDTTTTSNKTWSSNKISTELNKKPEIDDASTANNKVLSAEKITSEFGELPFPATQIVSASGNNLNDYHIPACFFAETGLTNLPTANDNFIVLNYYAKWQSATRYNLVQLAVNATNCKTYARVYTSSNNTWKSWLPLFYDATQLVADVEYNQDETDRIRQNIFGLNASKGENGFLKATGVVQANNGYVTTDYIRIYNGQSFSYRIGHGSELPVICFFTGKDKNYIVSAKTVTGIDGYVSGTFTAEQDGYIRITYSKTKNQGYVVFTDNIPDNIRLSINPNNLKDKNILCLGDSIFGNDGEIVGFLNDTGAVAVNGAFGGTQVSVRTGASDNFRFFDGVNLVQALVTQSWTDQDTAAAALASSYPWVVTRLAGLKAVDMSKVDIITMDWGTNDYTSGKTIAEITTAYNTVIDLLQQYYPSVRLLIIAPIWRYFGQKSDNENGDNKVYNVSTLKEIATAIDNNAKDKRIESLQMYQNMPLSYNTADLYFDSGDSTHLNTTGNKVYSQILIGKLRSMFG